MKNNKILLVLLVITLTNFIVQIPYYLHQYHTPPSIFGILLLTTALLWFLVGIIRLWQRKRYGFLLTISFLAVEFLFYLSAQVTQGLSGKGILLHVLHPDDNLLFIVFGIGYLNLLVSGFFIVYLFVKRNKSSKLVD